MASKLSTSLKWKHHAKVTGRGTFPLDMLRYDACMPTREEDANLIERINNPMITRTGGPEWTVNVYKHSDVKGHGYWNAARWASFHCKLEETAGDEYA